MTYRVKNNDVSVYIEASDVSAPICWVGIISDDDKCKPCSGEQTYCELIYVGENTSTSPTAHTGTIDWHGNTIRYTINQAAAERHEECTTETFCSGNSKVWISPYIVTKEAGGHDIKLFTEYSAITVTTCDGDTAITNVEKIISSGHPLSESAMEEFEDELRDKACSATDRTISVSYTLSDIVPCLSGEADSTGTAVCYVAEEEPCCDNSATSICYEISDISYTPSTAPFSGGTIRYTYDYRKNTTVNCVTSISLGSNSGTWVIPPSTIDDCKRHQITTSITPSELSDFSICKSNVSAITLSIMQDKNPDNTACTEITCAEGVGYCIDKASIKQFYYDNNNWIPITDNYIFPSYGGQLKVNWEYSAVTIYDDCSSAVTSGNTWEDTKIIEPYSGDCGEGVVGPFTIEYIFKTPFSGCESGNVFTIEYRQNKSHCTEDCPTCISDGSIEISSAGTRVGTDMTCTVLSAFTTTVPSWLSVTSGNNKIWFSSNEVNSGSNRSAKVVFDLGNDCSESVNVVQIGSGEQKDSGETEPPMVCPCTHADGLYFEVYGNNISFEGGSGVELGSFVSDECVINYSLPTPQQGFIERSWWDFSEDRTSGVLYGNVTKNCDCENERKIRIDGIRYQASGCSEYSDEYIEIVQSRNTRCQCNKVTATTVGEISSNSGNNVVIGSYQITNDCPPSNISTSISSNFISNITFSNGTRSGANGLILANVTCNDCNSTSRSCDISISYRLGDNTCNTAFTVTQKAGSSVTLIPSRNISCKGGNDIELATYVIEGGGSFTPNVSVNGNFVHSVNASNNKITGNVDPNCCNESNRKCTLTLSYGCNCIKSSEIIQNCGLRDKSITIDGENPNINIVSGGTLNLKLV